MYYVKAYRADGSAIFETNATIEQANDILAWYETYHGGKNDGYGIIFDCFGECHVQFESGRVAHSWII